MESSEAVIDQLAAKINRTANDKGFWEPPSTFMLHLGLKLALITSEVAEALDVLRTPYEDPQVFGELTLFQAEEFFEELADIIIRTLDIAGQFDWDMGSVLIHKMEKNAQRPQLHGKSF